MTALGTQEPIIDFGSDELHDEIIISRDYSFIKTTWNGISVIREKKSGYFYANGICRINGKKFENISSKSYWKRYITRLECRLHLKSAQCVKEILNVNNDLRGSYIHPLSVNFLCEHVDYDYAIDVSILLHLMDQKSKLENKTLHDEISQLQNEIVKLKQGKSDLEDELLEQTLDKEFLSYDNSKLQAQVKDLNTPINQSIQPSSIYASPVGDSHFQLRFSRESISKHSKIKNLKHVELINAKDVLEMTRKELKKNNETSKLNGKVVLPSSKIDQTFDLISKIKEGIIKLPTKEEVYSFIDKSILELKLKRLTPQVKGKIFELEQLKQRNFIPWSLLPKSFLGEKNEQSRDCGIDGIKFHENSIEEIVQIKFHNKPSYLSSNEIQSFINKCQQERYKTVEKLLIVHGCKVGKKMIAELEAMDIKIERFD